MKKYGKNLKSFNMSFQMRCASSAFSAGKITLITHFLTNPFVVNTPILYSLKTTENRKFSCIFRGY